MDIRTTVLNRASNNQVVRWIEFLSQLGSVDPKIYQLARRFEREPNPIKAAFDFAYNHVYYVPDPTHTQQLRMVTNSLRTRMGNCVDYVILLSSILRAMCVDHYYRRIGWDVPKKVYKHIYIVTKNGTVLDPVISQKQDGTDTLNNRPEPLFNKEVNYRYKKDTFIKTCKK